MSTVELRLADSMWQRTRTLEKENAKLKEALENAYKCEECGTAMISRCPKCERED